jgi:aspartate ammonia-lyase
MTKKKTAVAAQTVNVQAVDTVPDISNLSEASLNKLISTANIRRYELQKLAAAERDAVFAEAKKSDKVKALKDELKELSKEFIVLLKKGRKVTYQLPLTLTVNIDAYNDDTLVEQLANYDYLDVEWENLFQVNVDGELGRGDLPKDVHALMQENLENVLANACNEIARLTPELTKTLETFCKKVNKFSAKLVKASREADPNGHYSVADLLN